MKLTRDYLLSLLHYNRITGQFRWRSTGEVAGWTTPKGYVVITIDGVKYMAHKLAWLYMHNEWPERVDHKDGKSNAIINLRKCTQQQNMYNRTVKSNSLTGVKGVSFDKSRNKYLVRVSINGVNTNLGRYDDLELAELVATEARNKHHGEFARHVAHISL